MHPSFLRDRADRLVFICSGFSLTHILQTLAEEIAAEEAAATRSLRFFATSPQALADSIYTRLDAMRADLADATLIPVGGDDPVYPETAARVLTLRRRIEAALGTGELAIHNGRLLTERDLAALSDA